VLRHWYTWCWRRRQWQSRGRCRHAGWHISAGVPKSRLGFGAVRGRGAGRDGVAGHRGGETPVREEEDRWGGGGHALALLNASVDRRRLESIAGWIEFFGGERGSRWIPNSPSWLRLPAYIGIMIWGKASSFSVRVSATHGSTCCCLLSKKYVQ
jgi:hypothetical protein